MKYETFCMIKNYEIVEHRIYLYFSFTIFIFLKTIRTFYTGL